MRESHVNTDVRPHRPLCNFKSIILTDFAPGDTNSTTDGVSATKLEGTEEPSNVTRGEG